MKVDVFEQDPQLQERQKQELLTLLEQPGEKQERPCASCDVPCPCSASQTCACGCASTCRHASTRMSSEPERYPIEEHITPLVYSFNVMRVCRPCWSCEGHMDGQTEHSRRLPQVWFYSPSVLYPRLVAELLEQMRFQKKLKHEWCIRILGWGDKLNTRFSIMPVEVEANERELISLQQDSKVIAENMNSGVREKAKKCLKELMLG